MVEEKAVEYEVAVEYEESFDMEKYKDYEIVESRNTSNIRANDVGPVSYTHLDVYKRQALFRISV